MRAAFASVLLPAALLGACATPQENPNYQYSSLYEQKSESVEAMSAAYRSVPAPVRSVPFAAPAQEELSIYSRVEPGCIDIGNCYPARVGEARPPLVSEPWASPTEELFAGGETTPGFRAVEGDLAGDAPEVSIAAEAGVPEAIAPVPSAPVVAAPVPPEVSREAEVAAPTPAPSPIPSPRNVDEIPTLTISGPVHQALSGTQTRALMHRVEAGDTVYSLSRRYCTDVASVAELNGLGQEFTISVGQDLKLPARCEASAVAP